MYTTGFGIVLSYISNIKFYLSRVGFGLFLLWNFLLNFIKNSILGRVLVLLVVPVIIAYFYLFQPLPKDISTYEHITMEIPNGANFKQIADSLTQNDLLSHKDFFLLLGKITGKEKNIRAGRFEIPKGISTWQLLNFMKVAPVSRYSATLPEGILSHKMAGILEQKIGIDSSEFVSLTYDSIFAATLIPNASSLEGYLMPETYQFEWRTPEDKIIKHLVSSTLKIFEADTVQQRLLQMGMSQKEIITLASIIEGEALVDSERVYISSIYHNRLRLGMPLQADPTIQFAIPGPPRRLLNRDLEIESPYNTYKYAGLPPGPISNPGKNSIYAALYPKDTPYLYMVAVGDGRHRFSKTLREHNYWHAKFNEYRRKVRREQRAKQQ